ncbi:hypothetical protein D3C81_1980250 [compost metagenome]
MRPSAKALEPLKRPSSISSAVVRHSSAGITPPMDRRSFIRPVRVTFQPLFTSPTRWLSGTNTSLKNTSLNSDSPPAWRIGRISMPGVFMSR